jgi:hypothetical protein
MLDLHGRRVGALHGAPVERAAPWRAGCLRKEIAELRQRNGRTTEEHTPRTHTQRSERLYAFDASVARRAKSARRASANTVGQRQSLSQASRLWRSFLLPRNCWAASRKVANSAAAQRLSTSVWPWQVVIIVVNLQCGPAYLVRRRAATAIASTVVQSLSAHACACVVGTLKTVGSRYLRGHGAKPSAAAHASLCVGDFVLGGAHAHRRQPTFFLL